MGETFTDVKTIADRTKETREALGLSQVELAGLAKVSPGTIGNLEAGTRKNPRELLAIAEALNVNPEWLKSGKGPREAVGSESAYSEALTLSPAERDLILAIRKLPDEEQTETVRDVMHRAEVLDQLVARAMAKRGMPISGYVSSSRAAETIPELPGGSYRPDTFISHRRSDPDASEVERRQFLVGRDPDRRKTDDRLIKSPLTHHDGRDEDGEEKKA